MATVNCSFSRSQHSAVVIYKKMYVFGGITHSFGILNDLWRFSWESEYIWEEIITTSIPPSPRYQ